MKKLVVLGAGGYAQEVLWVVDDINRSSPTWDFLGFIDSVTPGAKGRLHYDRPVLGSWADAQLPAETYFACGIGAPSARVSTCVEAEERGLLPATLVHPSVITARHVQIGEGTIIGPGCILGPYAVLGKHCSLNLGVIIGHDAQVGDYSVFSPGARLLGETTLEERVFLGTGATVYQGRHVGAGSIIGANSFLLTNLGPNTTVIGVPATRVSVASGGGICTAQEEKSRKLATGEHHDKR